MSTLGEPISKWLIRLRWPMLAAAALFLIAAWQPSSRVDFDRSIENMFSADDPLLVSYRRLKERFGGNEIVLAAYRDDHLLDPEGAGIRQLASVSRELNAVDGVRDVLSLAEVSRALETIHPLKQLLDKDGAPAILDPESRLAEAYRELFVGYTHDRQGRTATLVCMLEPERDTEVPRRQTIDKIRSVVQRKRLGMIAGEPVMVIDGFRYVEQDGRRLGRSTTVLLAIAIVLFFRSLRWVVIPIAVVQLSLILTRATLTWSGIRLSMVSSMLTAIVTVVGVATVVHVIIRFRQARRDGLDQQAAFQRAAAIVAVPVFWACLTDAVGFLALSKASVGPVHDFGIMTAIGCICVLSSVVLVVPGLALWGHFDIDPHRAWGEQRIGLGLDRLIRAIDAHPKSLSAVLMVIASVATAGLFRLDVETDFTRNFRRHSPIVSSYRFIEEQLGGAGVWDIVIPSPATLSESYVNRVRKMEEELRRIRVADRHGRQVPGLTKVLSLVDGVDASAVNPLLARIPPELRARAMAATMPSFMAALRAQNVQPGDRNYLRIMLRAPEQRSAGIKTRVIHEVERVVRRHFPSTESGSAAEVTGFYVLLTNLITSVLRDQWICFAIATLGVGLMMALAFRSPTLALIALVPNILPVVVVLGSMGWLGWKINLGAAMIAAVSMGLSVDSSIHYICSYQRARQEGMSVREALDDVQQSVGRAVVFSTMALVVGFLALCLSQFVPTIYFGCLVSLAMLGGLIGNLVILPLLLALGEGSPEGNTTKDTKSTKDGIRRSF